MYLSVKERNKTFKLIETLGQSLDSKVMRKSTGFALLDILKTAQFASFVSNEEGKYFDKGVCINISDDNIASYSEYYQKKDPITGKLSVRRNATLVNEIMPQQDLLKTEFYNDFLAKDGLHYGINLYAYTGNKNVGDFRVWRKKGRNNFDEKSAYILNLIKPYFCNAMSNITQHEAVLNHVAQQNNHPDKIDINKLMLKFSLTKREAQITLEILQGYKDDDIATKLHIAFSTLRTHIKHIFYKLDVNNRPLLIRKVFCEAH